LTTTDETTPTLWADGFGNWHVMVPSVWDEELAYGVIADALLERGLASQSDIDEGLCVTFVRATTGGAEFKEDWDWRVRG